METYQDSNDMRCKSRNILIGKTLKISELYLEEDCPIYNMEYIMGNQMQPVGLLRKETPTL